MLRALVGCGPGGSAVWTDPDRRCRLGVAGRCWGALPPRLLHHDGLVAVCDGHLFDREGMAGADERLLRRWTRTGPHGFGEADSQFGLAIWDPRVQQLTLARDAVGMRSLYYCHHGQGVIFASTIEALVGHPAVPLDVDASSIASFFRFQNVPPPATLFTGVVKLPPGSVAVFDASGGVRVERFWTGLEVSQPNDARAIASRLGKSHRDAVAARVINGPMAAVLGGPHDASAEAALMVRFGVPELHTFACGLAGDGELARAREVAASVGSIHHDRVLADADIIDAMPRLIDALCDPVAEPASVFLLHALELMRSQRLGVAIAGDPDDGSHLVSAGYYRRWRQMLGIMRRRAAPARNGSPRSPRIDESWTESELAELVARRALAGPADRDGADAGLVLGGLEQLSSRLGIELRCAYAAPTYARLVRALRAAPPPPAGKSDPYTEVAVGDLPADDLALEPCSAIAELFRGDFGRWAESALLDGGLTNAGLMSRDVLAGALDAHRSGARDVGMRLWSALIANLWYDRWVTRLARERPAAGKDPAQVEPGGRDSQRKIARASDSLTALEVISDAPAIDR